MSRYETVLKNQQCTFDREYFSSLKAARKWASGRGMEHLGGNKWAKYEVNIFKDGECILVYKTQ